MASTNALDESFVETITATLSERVAQLKGELVGITDEFLASSPAISSKSGLATGEIVACSFERVVDAVHSLAPFVPVKAAPVLKQMLYGIEDLHALTDGFIRALSSSKNLNETMKFQVFDRKTGRGLLVALPPAAYPSLVADINKTLRKLKQLHK